MPYVPPAATGYSWRSAAGSLFGHASGARERRPREGVVRLGWWVVSTVVGLVPVALMLLVAHIYSANMALAFCLVSGLIALSLMVVAFALTARMPSILAAFGVERVLRGHRAVALVVVALVIAHLLCVFVGDPRGVGVLVLTRQPKPVWAATTSTVALGLLVAFAARRRDRHPRYEGWRMMHIGLAAVVLIAAGLHVLWLHHLVRNQWLLVYFLLLLFATLAVGARRWVWRPLQARRRAYAVENITRESGDVITVTIRADGHGGVPFRPGQFAWLKIGTSPFVFEEHPFTIASTAERPDRKQFTIKALGDFSELLIGMRPGRHVYIDGPYGGFTVDGLRSPGFVFIAGGVGITPMLSMLRTLADRGDRRPHLLLVTARSEEDLVLRQELAVLRRRIALTVVEVVKVAPRGWIGEVGRIDGPLLDRRLPRLARHQDYFLCGPPAMVASVAQLLRQRRIPAARIHTELFDVV